MKLIRTEDAVGHVLCHDLTQILPGEYKGARFRKGHVVTAEDIPALLSMGKENLYVWELAPGMVHEDEAAARLCALCRNDGMTASDPKEGKIELTADFDGLFTVDSRRLQAVNAIDELMIATRRGSVPVKRGDKLCGTRVIPLVIAEEKLRQAEAICGGTPLLKLLPYTRRTACLVITGNEVKTGRIADQFSPVVKAKLAQYGITVLDEILCGDGVENVKNAIAAMQKKCPDMILCTGGMSVDPDDNTPGGIRAAGAEIVTYGAPVLPGAMFLLGYFPDGVPVLGLPGCVMYAATTIFDLMLPRLAAGVRLKKQDFTVLGEGGLCLGCKTCRWPDCAFGIGGTL